jgi:hypothetical protein
MRHQPDGELALLNRSQVWESQVTANAFDATLESLRQRTVSSFDSEPDWAAGLSFTGMSRTPAS